MEKETMPTVSVIIPIFSGEMHLCGCIDSLLNQTYKNLQIILVNDGSTDASGRICDEYAARDGRITVIHKENGGVSSARNAGLRIARGEWIGFIDSDDAAEPDMYEYLIGKANEYGAELVQCAMLLDAPDGTSTVSAPESDVVIGASSEADAAFFRFFSGGACCKLFSGELIKDLSFDEDLTIGEDMRFNLDALVRSGRTVLATAAKYHYVQHETSACNSVPNRDRLTSYLRMLDKARRDFENHPAVSAFLKVETVKGAMDVCSKAVRFGFKEGFCEARAELKKHLAGAKSYPLLTKKERLKAMLIAYTPALYKIIIRLIK